ncbi:MAG: adenylate/guanylate cyclase domain-containing protein [Elainellaceae cyanobacterium]
MLMRRLPNSRGDVQPTSQLRQNLESTLNETRLTAFLSEFLGNSGHFLILTSLADLVVDGWRGYLTDFTNPFLFLAMMVQTIYLSRSHASRFWGNLIGVSLYTLVDLPQEGQEFFQAPAHWVFGIFSLAIALLQSTRYHWKPELERWVFPLESMVRMGMVLAFYVVVGLGEKSNQTINLESLQQLSLSETHLFLGVSLTLIGLLLGFQQLQIVTQRRQLQDTAVVLQHLAEWGMGTYAVATAVTNPAGLAFQKCDRAIVFMDIRGFTVWCEQTETEIVAQTLNSYYQRVEPAASCYDPLRVTLTGDEIMAIYATPEQAVAAAQAMQKIAIEVLRPYHLGAGCAVHYGAVVEGLFGGDGVRTYTVIGDVVNTAKRLEGATPAEEITISDTVYQLLKGQIEVKRSISLHLKGKVQPFASWLLA